MTMIWKPVEIFLLNYSPPYSTHFPYTVYYWGYCTVQDDGMFLRQVLLPQISKWFKKLVLTYAFGFNISFCILKSCPVVCNFPRTRMKMYPRHPLLSFCVYHAEVILEEDHKGAADTLPMPPWKGLHTGGPVPQVSPLCPDPDKISCCPSLF